MSDVEAGPGEVEWVSMRHEGIEGVATTTREAFDVVHSRKGWEIVSELGWATQPPPATEPLPIGLDRLSKVELQDLAAERGLETSGTKDELKDRLEAAGEG